MKKIIVVGIVFMFILINSSVFSASNTNINIIKIKDLLSSRSEGLGDFLTIYNFKGITFPSSNHMASYKLSIKDFNDRPPKTGPIIDDLKEFSTTDYIEIYNSDDNRADTSSSLGKQLHHFQFNIKENISEIKSLNVLWLGYASSIHTNFYIWNFKNNDWELVGINRFTSRDAVISKTYINGISNYIDNTKGHLYLVAITRILTIFERQLFTNYVQVKVGNPNTVTLQDDAYHYNNESDYSEWWFFDVINETQNIQFFISYHIFDPKNGFATIDIGIFNGNNIYEIRKTYPLSEFYASYEKPYVLMNDCIIDTLDENTFLIKGNINGNKNSVTWNLTFKRTAPPYDFIESPGEMQYLCYLPGAWVDGIVKLNSVKYSINNSYGYHDHNWGGGPFLTSQWAWAATCKPEDEFSLAMEKVEHFRWHTHALYVTVGNNTIYFEDIDTSFEEFILDVKLSFPFFTYYPKIRHIYAENDEGYVIDFNAIVQKNLPIYMGVPRVLNEQVSLFQGTLSKNGQTIYSFNVLGFTDYSIF